MTRPPYLRVALVGVVGARVLYLLALYELGDPDTHRYHVESAAVAFLVIGALVRWSLGAAPGERAHAPGSQPAAWWWPVFIAAAVLLYGPALGVGYLSDDFDLVRLAREWRLGPVSAGFIRPVPLAVWGALQTMGAGAAILHGLNVVLHGTNAYLTSRLAARWLPSGPYALLAGAFVLASPLAPEPVVWSSGVFDVSATTLVLCLVLQGRHYASATWRTRLVFFATAVVAMLCKETAVVGAALVLVDAWVAGTANRRLLRDALSVLVGAAVFSGVRIALAFGVPNPALTRHVVRRSLFETFGALAEPWHADVVAAAPWLSIAAGAVVLGGLAAFFLTTRRPWRLVAGAALWVLISVAPVFRIVIVAADLGSSRYLYLGTCAWAVLVAGLPEAWPHAWARRTMAVATVCLVLMSAVAVRWELAHWLEAAALRDRVVSALRDAPAFASCASPAVAGVPDNVRGAYVFRNGGPEAIRLATGKLVAPQAGPECTLTWDPIAGRFVSGAAAR